MLRRQHSKLTLLTVAAFDLAPIFRLGTFFGKMTFLIAVAAGEIGRVLGFSALRRLVTLLSSQRQRAHCRNGEWYALPAIAATEIPTSRRTILSKVADYGWSACATSCRQMLCCTFIAFLTLNSLAGAWLGALSSGVPRLPFMISTSCLGYAVVTYLQLRQANLSFRGSGQSRAR